MSEARYEVQDASVREIVLTGIGLAVGTAIVCLFVWGIFNLLKRNDAAAQAVNVMGRHAQGPPDPKLQVAPWEELMNLRRHEDEVLRTYGWVDRSNDKIHIPIDRAIDIMVERGGVNAPAR